MPAAKIRRSAAVKSETSQKTSSPHGPDDQIKLQYDIYMNKSDKHIMILQFPNRDRKQPYNLASGQKPLELRIKPRSGLVELDIPMVIDRHYDRAKGIRYGQAMRKSRVLRQGASYGLAGGLGVNGASRSTRDDLRGPNDELPDEILHENFEEANNRGYIMNKITLGGRIIKPENGKPNYCIGAFKGHALHLTRVSTFCMLTPQFHHLDALADNEKASARAQREAENPVQESEARAVNVAVKSTDNEELDIMGQVAKELREIEEEPWQRLEWVDENDIRAFHTYDKQLVLDEEFRGTQLVSAMTKQQYLDAVSAPRVDPTKQGKKIMISRPTGEESSDDSNGETEAGKNTRSKKGAKEA